MTTHWYALKIKPRKENAVFQLLQSREIDVFYPTIRVKPKDPRSARTRPYFPGYMFVAADLEAVGQNAFSWLPGTQGLVAFGGMPAVVSVQLIQTIKKQLDHLKTISEQPYNEFKKGDVVRITSGLLEGYQAIFDLHLAGKERVQVLLAFLSQYPQPIQLHPDDITKVKKQ